MSLSSDIAKEIEKILPAEVVHVDLIHTKEIMQYVQEIEDAHKRAANSTLTFGSQ